MLEFSPPGTFRIFRDGVLLDTGRSGFAVSGRRIFFREATGGANAHAEIRALRFVQDLATPARSTTTTWGRVKAQ